MRHVDQSRHDDHDHPPFVAQHARGGKQYVETAMLQSTFIFGHRTQMRELGRAAKSSEHEEDEQIAPPPSIARGDDKE